MNRLKQKQESLFFPLAIGIILCIALYGWYCYWVRYGINRIDESFYLTVTQRMAQGDRLLVDEWHVTQLTALLQYIPYILYVRIHGSTEGIILYMRYVYLFMSFCVYWFTVYKLRKTPKHAVACAFLLCGFVPFAIFAPNYYNLPPLLLLVVCLILCGPDRPPKAWEKVLCGVLYSAAVLMVPGLTFLYAIYSAFALASFIARRKKKLLFPTYDFILNQKTWLFVFFGVLGAAVCFCVYIGFTSGWPAVLKSFPNLLTDSEYSLSANGKAYRFLIEKTKIAIGLFGRVNTLLAVFTAAGCACVRIFRKRMKNENAVRLIMTALAAVIFLSLCIFGFITHSRDTYDISSGNKTYFWFYFIAYPLPLAFLTLCLRFLHTEREEPWFLFWWVGLFSSLFKDLLSDVSFGGNLILCVIPFVFSVGEIISRLKTSKINGEKKTLRIVISSALALFLGAFLFFHVNEFYSASTCMLTEKYYNQHKEETCDSRIGSGPYMGIFTTQRINSVYSDLLSDLDHIKTLSDGPVYFPRRFSYGYLYLDLPYSVYSTWFVTPDLPTRQTLYWDINPQRIPDVIYISKVNPVIYDTLFDDQEMLLEQMGTYFDFTISEGKAGKFLLVSAYKGGDEIG